MTIKFDESPAVLPTPPHSPPSQHPNFFAYPANQSQVVSHRSHIHQLHHADPHPHHKHTATLIGSLTSFYQQEQYWIHSTRAALELAITKGIDSAEAQSCSASSGQISPALSDASCSSVRVKAEPEAESAVGLASPASSTSSALASPTLATAAMSAADQQQASRWLRRKNRMRLHLSGISTNNPNRRRRPARAPPSEPAARLLEMFAELVDARMESCVRMERLVRESGRGCGVC